MECFHDNTILVCTVSDLFLPLQSVCSLLIRQSIQRSHPILEKNGLCTRHLLPPSAKTNTEWECSILWKLQPSTAAVAASQALLQINQIMFHKMCKSSCPPPCSTPRAACLRVPPLHSCCWKFSTALSQRSLNFIWIRWLHPKATAADLGPFKGTSGIQAKVPSISQQDHHSQSSIYVICSRRVDGFVKSAFSQNIHFGLWPFLVGVAWLGGMAR
jgi:hypothetical protein